MKNKVITVIVQRETLAVLVDTITGSLDYGSGFLDIEDVQALWDAALTLDIPLMDVTPSEFRHLLPHPMARHSWESETVRRCSICGKDVDFECHSPIVE